MALTASKSVASSLGSAVGLLRDGQSLVLEPGDVEQVLMLAAKHGLEPRVTMLDPWYNKGVGGERDDYGPYILRLLDLASAVSPHVFLWGFPEIVAQFVGCLPPRLTLNCWLTWYYKNNPSVIRGWRSSQMACLHLTRSDAVLYPEHFLNEAQLHKKAQGKLRYMPGPTSVIESSLIIGFVGRAEQTGHPSQKPCSVYEPLYKMTTRPGDLVLDPMAGSGTTGAVAKQLGFRAILNDVEPKYVTTIERRLGIGRVGVTR
jgi:site-specific DNA-methyltransferase (adenine-specific)